MWIYSYLFFASYEREQNYTVLSIYADNPDLVRLFSLGTSHLGQSMPGVQITSGIRQPRQLLKPKVSPSWASSGSYSAKGQSYWGQSRHRLKPKVSPSGVSPCWAFRLPAVFASPGSYSNQRSVHLGSFQAGKVQ